jgi:hypothetical protein
MEFSKKPYVAILTTPSNFRRYVGLDTRPGNFVYIDMSSDDFMYQITQKQEPSNDTVIGVFMQSKVLTRDGKTQLYYAFSHFSKDAPSLIE